MKAEATPEDDVIELAELLDAKTITPAEVLALIKAAKAAPVTATEPVAEDVRKGMGNVANLAYTLRSIMSMVKDQIAECAREGDASTVPAALADWLDAGGGILKDMVTEEVGELMAQISPENADPVVQYVYMADKALALAALGADELTKAGKALSAASMSKIKAIHDASAALGACDAAGKAGHADDLAKAATEAADALAKAADDLAKAEARAVTAEAAIEPLRKRVTELESMPAPGKALLKAVSKGQDLNDPAAAGPALVAPVTKSDGSVSDVATLIKQIHARPGATLSV
jgi:hypothetical protein